MKKLCIYHANCADGFGAAWAVRKALGDNVEFYAGHHGSPPPDVTDREVIMFDFSYKLPVIQVMLEQAKSIVIVDHHKSAMEDLGEFKHPKLTLTFDMNRSGAMMAWDYFFRGTNPPKLIEYIQDRDLWHFKLEDSRMISAALFSYPYEFAVWDMFMTEAGIEKLRSDGAAIERKHFKDINELLAVNKRRLVIGGVNVPAANLPYCYGSDAGHIMDEGEPFAACYSHTNKGVAFSLRSREDGMDVSAIAKLYGGGGHKHAAGFSVSLAVAATFEVPHES